MGSLHTSKLRSVAPGRPLNAVYLPPKVLFKKNKNLIGILLPTGLHCILVRFVACRIDITKLDSKLPDTVVKLHKSGSISLTFYTRVSEGT